MSEHRTKPTVEAGIVARGLNVVDYQPGNGTRYVVVLTPILHETDAKLLGAPVYSALFTFPLWGKSIVLPPEQPVFAWWIGEKLGLNRADAVPVTELLACLLGVEADLG